MKTKLIIFLGTIFLLICMVGCQSDPQEASSFLSKPEVTSPEESTEEEIEDPDTNCSAINPHPVAEGITETFDITYDEVMTLYCDGYAFTDILLALETSELVDQTPVALLARLRTRTWQEIWDEFGVSPE